MRTARKLLALLAIAGATLAPTGTASAELVELQPVHLRVAGDAGAWHAENEFRLDWDRPPLAATHRITAANFRIRDAAGTVVVPRTRVPGNVVLLEGISVPPQPGIYTAEVWLEAAAGPGPPVSVALRFDDTPPGLARPLAPPGWVAGDQAALVRIERPSDPQPLSGIRGYAVSVGPESAPCAVPDRCSVSETDLRGGAGGDTLSLGILPQGAHEVRAVAVSGAGVSSAQSQSAIVRVDATPPEVVLVGVPRGWVNGPVRLTAAARDGLSGMATDGPGGPHTAISLDGGVPRMERGDAAAAIVSGEGTHRVTAFARDAAGNVGAAPATTVSIDSRPPAVTFARSENAAEPERIEATVTDLLAGPSTTRGSIAVRLAGSRQRWRTLPAAVSAGRLTSLWDSDSFAPGRYEFSATGYDAAGNATVSERRANGARMVLTNPLKAQARIEAGFGEQLAATRTVRYGSRAVYGGRLTSKSGAALGSLPVRVVELFDRGSDLAQRTTVLQTGPDGSFQTALAPGPSRQVEVLFGGNRVLSRTSGGRGRMDVASGVRLRASAATAKVGGRPVVFNGRVGVLGARLPAGGRAVELQFRVARGRWSEFRTVQTDAGGRFRYAYAFSDDDSRGVRFQFRAYTSGGDWPYEPAASKAVTVTGAG